VNAQEAPWDCGCIPDRACERTRDSTRNFCRVKVGGVGVKGMIMLKKLEHLCETVGQDSSIHSFTGATKRFGGATARYRPLRAHSGF